MSTSANKPIEDIEASLLAATKWALDELLRQADATMAAKAGGDFSPGSPIEGYDHASSYLRQVLGFIGITDLDIVLAGSARAGMAGETSVEEFGEVLALAAAA
jgi:FMN-dependent NADH-azoreductase